MHDFQEKAAKVQEMVDAKFGVIQRKHLEETKTALRDFVKDYHPYSILALPLVAAEVLPELEQSLKQ